MAEEKPVTVDDLVDYCATQMKRGMYQDTYLHLIIYHSMSLLKILKSDTNKPSVHDITLISKISRKINQTDPTQDLYDDLKQILEIYKNRKV